MSRWENLARRMPPKLTRLEGGPDEPCRYLNEFQQGYKPLSSCYQDMMFKYNLKKNNILCSLSTFRKGTCELAGASGAGRTTRGVDMGNALGVIGWTCSVP